MARSESPSSLAAASAADRLRVNEIFFSLQGEARTVGFPTVFVRLTGCPLRCGYCDTEYAFTEGRWMSFEEVEAAVAQYAPRHVTVTGGEPLAQRPCRTLLKRLCDHGYEVSLETSGALDIGDIDARVSVVMDLKTPGSGEEARNRIENIALLKPKDQVSPVHGELSATELAEWILADRLPVRMQIQLHKYLWQDARGR
ncbi:MAG: 7-carboxy-7-deazaguanine synthase [Acidithiobacillales bacterium SM23_46]|nr:MAG: 7-carboxy-7-deazaguanine synthase [Acidithiobacillales bacterium SM23_46]